MRSSLSLSNRSGKNRLAVGLGMAAGLLTVLPGCANQHHAANADPAITHPDANAKLAALLVSEEHVQGHFYLVGGPPGPPRPLPGTVTFTGPVTKDVSVGNSGRILTLLPPGHYLAEGVSPLMGGYPCRPGSKVTVKPNELARVNVYCRVP